MLPREAYRVLGIEPGISGDEVRSRYRVLVKELHPDVSAGTDEQLGRIIEAYRVINGLMKTRSQRNASRTHGSSRSNERARSRRPAAAAYEAQKTARTEKRRRVNAQEIFRLGRVAVGSFDGAVRISALKRLCASGMRSSGVFVRQCLFDSDAEVAFEAARLLPTIAGARTEAVVIEVFDQLTLRQCRALIQEVVRKRIPMRRFLAYAAADPRESIRRIALEVLS